MQEAAVVAPRRRKGVCKRRAAAHARLGRRIVDPHVGGALGGEGAVERRRRCVEPRDSLGGFPLGHALLRDVLERRVRLHLRGIGSGSNQIISTYY